MKAIVCFRQIPKIDFVPNLLYNLKKGPVISKLPIVATIVYLRDWTKTFDLIFSMSELLCAHGF